MPEKHKCIKVNIENAFELNAGAVSWFIIELTT
jgi:hypothetical protein